MRHSYDQSEYTRPGEEFSLPPEQSATLSGGRRFADRFGMRKRALAEPDESEKQAAEVLAEEGPAGAPASVELTPSEASSASADAQQTVERRAKKKRSLLLQFAAAASSVVLVTNSFGIDLLGMDGLFNDSVIFGEVHSSEPDHWNEPDDEPEPDLIYGDLIPFGGDRVFPRLDNNDWTVTQDTTVDANNKYIAAVDFINGSMGEQAMVESFVWYGRKAPQFYTGPIPMSVPENAVPAESPSIYYDFDTNTLTLNNYHGKGLMINNMGQDFTIRLEGDSVLSEYLMVACGSVTITGDGGIIINSGQHYDYGIHVVGQWTNAHLMLDENVKFDISGAHSIFRVTSTCSEKPVWYKTPHPWAEIYQGQLKAEDTSFVREDPETYHSWLMVGAQTHSTIVKLNNSYRPGDPAPGGTEPEPSSEAPATTVMLPVGGDSSFPMLPNPMPGSVGADGAQHESSITIREKFMGMGFTDERNIFSNGQNHSTGRDDVYYDPSENVLTFNNYTGGNMYIRNMGNSFKIRLIGRNELYGAIEIVGDVTSGSITFTGDGYLALNTAGMELYGILANAYEASACIMIDSSVTMDIYGEQAVVVWNTAADKAIYYKSDSAISGLMQKCGEGEKGETLGHTVHDWKIVDGQGDPVTHIHIGGETPPETTQSASELQGLPVGGDSLFPVLPNPDPNTPVPGYGLLDEDYIQVFDRLNDRWDFVYVNRNRDDGTVTEPGLSYDESTNTLTLANYHGAGISANLLGNSFTVELIGENVLTQDFMVWGFYTGGSIRFTGDGSLTVNADNVSEIGLYLAGEYSESCIMIESGVTLDIYGKTYAVLVENSNADKGIYLISPAPRPGIRQAVLQQSMPDMDFAPQQLHNTWILVGSDFGNALTRFRIEGSGWTPR